MLERLKYINHINETLSFGEGKLYVNENDLHNFAWDVTSKNDRISGFKKGIVSKTLPILLKVDTAEEGIKLRNQLFEVCEKDVLAVKHGRIVIGDYYMKCFVTESAKTDYLINKGYMKITLKIQTDFPYWVKETTTAFNHGSAGSEGKNMDYNRDYPSDYTSNLLATTLQNTGFVPSNFIMRIHGACETPCVTIAGHDYQVNTSVAVNEYITIDSVNKTITLTKANGATENCFNARNKGSYIFEKMPVGSLNVAASAGFKFEVVLLEERSEPKWT
jgi:hypothetical protein